MKRVGAALLALACAGCSLVFSQGPPPHHERMAWFDCSDSVAPPLLDVAGVALYSLALVVALSAEESTENPRRQGPEERRRAIASSAVLAAIAAPSAVHGFVTRARCVEAQRALAQRQRPPAILAPSRPSWPPAVTAPTSPDAAAPSGAGAPDAGSVSSADSAPSDPV